MDNSDEYFFIGMMIFYVLYFASIFGGTLILWGISYRVHPENREHMTFALNRLQNRWGTPIGATAILFAICMALYFASMMAVFLLQFIMVFVVSGVAYLQSQLGIGEELIVGVASFFMFFVMIPALYALFLFCFGPILAGTGRFFLNFFRSNSNFGDLFSFFNSWKGVKRSAGALFQIYLFYSLWCLLLIIPGIVALYSYSLTFFILSDNPNMSGHEAIKLSKKMMYGHKAELFWLLNRFNGWGFVTIFSSGVGYLWLIPYMSGAMTSFYDKVKAEYESRHLLPHGESDV